MLIGGFNIEDDYFRRADEGGWRDIGLIVDGPAAARLAPYFDALMDWAQTKRARIRELRRHHPALQRDQRQAAMAVRRRRCGALSPWAVSTARDLGHGCDVEMIAAYFAPPWGMLKRIARVGTAGPGAGHHRRQVGQYGDHRRRPLHLQPAAEARRRDVTNISATKLHSKLLVFDDVVHIGSSNFDIRSLYLNMETDAAGRRRRVRRR